MLQTVQIIAIIQGLFLAFILFKNKSRYKKMLFWLFLGSIVSVLLYLIGDDDNNLFYNNVDMFLFDSSLFITFLFLFLKYYKSEIETFDKRDYLFFIPNIIYFIIEAFEIVFIDEYLVFEVLELVIELTFLSYLIYIIYDFFKYKRRTWLLYFVVPLVLLMSVFYINNLIQIFGFEEIEYLKDSVLNSSLLLIIAFLFYVITYKLINDVHDFLPKSKLTKYKTSNLKPELINHYKEVLVNAMETDELYVDSKMSIHEVSQQLNIPRQYISEVLNLHMQSSFQDFLNTYRVEKFIKSLGEDQYKHYTLFGIATEVGFNSKSSFNATFKKIKGLTPSQYRKTFLDS